MIALPNELLGGILRRAWADRPRRPAAEELCAAAGLASVCRRMRALLRERPLPLALDFSAAPLSTAQRRWLLDPAQAGRVEAAHFHVASEADAGALWEQPVLASLLALHGRTLQHMSGVPLHLVARTIEEERPALDLSALRLTTLGLDCYAVRLCVIHADFKYFWPERLPGTLQELHLLGLEGSGLGYLAWALHSRAALAGRLPRLRTVRVTGAANGEMLNVWRTSLLEAFTSLPRLEVDGTGLDVSVDIGLFKQVGSVRIQAGGRLGVCADEWEGEAVLVDCLCRAGLQAAELGAEDGVGPRHSDGPLLHKIVRDMISRHGDCFAVDVGVAEQLYDDHGDWDQSVIIRRLAWRRWPAPGAPDLQAARAAHERARAWAVGAEQWAFGAGATRAR